MKCCRFCVPPKRYPGCHDHCPEHKAEKAEEDERKAAANKKHQVDMSIYKQKHDGVYRALKRRGRNRKN